MSIRFALLLSLALHLILVIAPAWRISAPQPAPAPTIEARLTPPAATIDMAEALTSIPAEMPPQLKPPSPMSMRGRSLRRTQAAFSEHLFYPPAAVAQGLEGEVILLLTLAADGGLARAEVARSSGHALLDQAALDAAWRVGKLHGSPRQTLFPVSFRLR